MTTTTRTPAEIAALRAEATRSADLAAESFARCDTDGFLSQWAHGLNSQQASLEADIAEAGGTGTFLALFTLDGTWTPAKRVSGNYGPQWLLLDATGRSRSEWLPYVPARRSTLARRGYTEGYVTRPAKADIVGNGGRGLSGAASCQVRTVPADHEWDPPLEIVTVDRFDGAESLLRYCHRCFYDGRGEVVAELERAGALLELAELLAAEAAAARSADRARTAARKADAAHRAATDALDTRLSELDELLPPAAEIDATPNTTKAPHR